MIHYPHVIMEFAGATWAIQLEKLEQIMSFILVKGGGGAIAPETREAYATARAAELARITKAQEEAARSSDGKIALIPIYGTIAQRANRAMEMSGGTSTQMLGAAFRSALNDSGVSAIVFDINSPGGTVAGTGELAAEILDSRGKKPIIAQVNSMAASGAYWLASAADEIVSTPGGEAGSLGVYRIHEDITKALESEGVKPTIIRSSQSPYKIEDSGLEPLTLDAQNHIQQRVDQSMDTFIRAVADGRKKTLTQVREGFGQGRMFGAAELVNRGMADRIDTLEATLERFGSGSFNPVANARRAERAEAIACENQAKELVAILRAGGQPDRRVFEHGIKGLAAAVGETLSNTEAEAIVKLLQMPASHGGHATRTSEPVTVAAVAEALRPSLADMLQHLKVPA